MQQPMPHQLMGYDRAITMFSPDGRLLQVEYAKKTVKQGSTAIAVVCSDGVLIVADKRISEKLIVPESVEKIFMIDQHIATTAAGILSDARVLVDRSQVKAQQHKVQYDAPIDSVAIVKDICNLKQVCTQSGGLRPFGVSLLIAAVDPDGVPRVFETDPTGIFFQYKASVIGEGDGEIEEILNQEYKDSMKVMDALKMSIKAMSAVLNKQFTPDKIDAAMILKSDKKFTVISEDVLDKVLKDTKKK